MRTNMDAYSRITFGESQETIRDWDSNDCVLRVILSLHDQQLLIFLLSPSTVIFMIIKETEPVEMIRFRLASVAAYKLVGDFMQHAFNTKSLIDGFFPNELAAEFQLLQHRTGLIASGSSGLGFFIRTPFPGADFDLFVKVCFRAVVEDFLSKAGYNGGRILGHHSAAASPPVQIVADSETYSANAIASVYEYHNSDDKKVQVIFCTQSPIDVLLSFHSTAPMNFVAHDVAVSLYPRATFNIGVDFNRAVEKEPAVTGQHKYANRGWPPADACVANEDAHLWGMERFIGDRHCWVIPLPIECVPKPDANSAIGHSWTLSYLEGDKGWASQYSILQRQFPYAALCVSDRIARHVTEDLLECSDGHLPLVIAAIIGANPVPNSGYDSMTALNGSMDSCTIESKTESKDKTLTNEAYEFGDTMRPILPAPYIPSIHVKSVGEGSVSSSNSATVHDCEVHPAQSNESVDQYYNFADTPRRVIPTRRVPPVIEGLDNKIVLA